MVQATRGVDLFDGSLIIEIIRSNFFCSSFPCLKLLLITFVSAGHTFPSNINREAFSIICLNFNSVSLSFTNGTWIIIPSCINPLTSKPFSVRTI